MLEFAEIKASVQSAAPQTEFVGGVLSAPILLMRRENVASLFYLPGRRPRGLDAFGTISVRSLCKQLLKQMGAAMSRDQKLKAKGTTLQLRDKPAIRERGKVPELYNIVFLTTKTASEPRLT